MPTAKKAKPSKFETLGADALKPIQSYALQFALITIPVGLCAVTKELKSIMTRSNTHKGCGTKLNQGGMVCSAHGAEPVPVAEEDIIMAHHYAKGQYVEITEAELKALPVAARNVIKITKLVPAAEIDPILIDKSYALEPGTGGMPSYALLYNLLANTSQVALATLAVKGPQDRLCSIRAAHGRLWVHLLYWAQELRLALDGLDAPACDAQHLQMIEMVAQPLAGHFLHEDYQPVYAAAWQELIAKKLADPTFTQTETAAPQETSVIDLMAMLQASLAAATKAA
jgi:DNA end-binding protein Ku